MRRIKQRSYRELLRDLREIMPPLVPVRTRRRRLKDCVGYTTLIHDAGTGLPTHFVMAIDSRLSWEATWLTLIHEWAHAVAWRQDHDTTTDHDPEFGLAYSRVWGDVCEP